MHRIRSPHQAVLALTAFNLVELFNLYPFLLNLKEVMMKFQFVQHHEPESACVGCGNPKGEFDDRNNPELADHSVKVP